MVIYQLEYPLRRLVLFEVDADQPHEHEHDLILMGPFYLQQHQQTN
ncbi:oriE replication initiation protein [Enterobacteria phage T6]|uniref:OriE replication initiation protein n=1 Tax=Enterobacteria phage T6 TaxID=10666 RepID=A0A346FJM6_BPT6|nr:oriE replication initiation protein [Enterobacteria phage T6]